MLAALRFHPIFIWLLLMLATALSWWLGGNGTTTALLGHTSLGILAIALVKVRFVIMDFMEIRHAPPALRWALEAWLLAVFLILASFFWG